MITPPAAPVDLTAEVASNSNALGDGDRGVFLTWNQVEDPDTETASYRIERIRMNTGVDALNSKDGDDEDSDIDWQYLERVSDVTSWTDETPLRQDDAETPSEETRMYQVCSEASGVTEPVCVVMAVDYALHPEMHPVDMITLGDASGLTAMKNSDGTMVTLSWTAGTNANIHWVAGVRKNADGTYDTADVANTVWTKADMHSSHTVDVSGLTAGTYVFTVIAGQYNAATMAENWNSAWFDPVPRGRPPVARHHCQTTGRIAGGRPKGATRMVGRPAIANDNLKQEISTNE